MEIKEFDFLYLVCIRDGLSPVSLENIRDMTVFLSRSETSLAGFLTENADDAGAVGIEDDDTDTESEMLEILTDTEEIRREVVVH